MLILTEISEAVEADRKGLHAVYNAVEYCYSHEDKIDVESRNRYFERDIKSTLEDELADVCIRIFDLCGMLGIVPKVYVDEIREKFDEVFGENFEQLS